MSSQPRASHHPEGVQNPLNARDSSTTSTSNTSTSSSNISAGEGHSSYQQASQQRLPAPGPLTGLHGDGVRSWRGIPFGRIPAGHGRWRAPQPYPTWDEVYAADTYQPPAAQPGYSKNNLQDWTIGTEDCLFLDIVRPDHDDTVPVVVYFHGGSFIKGASHQEILRGHQFVVDLNVVYVAINFRLGVLGYLDVTSLDSTLDATNGADAAGSGNHTEEHPTNDNPTVDNPTVANPALHDQILALRWVRDNIAQFGGDANNVTIMGESAGAAAVLALMASPPAWGLFHKAIVQSAPAATFHHPDQAAFWAHRLADHMGITTPPGIAPPGSTTHSAIATAIDQEAHESHWASNGSECGTSQGASQSANQLRKDPKRGAQPTTSSPDTAEHTTSDNERPMHATALDQLRALPVEELVRAGQTLILRNPSFGPLNSAFAPAIEPGVLPMHPLDAFRCGAVADVPLLIGTNNDEASFTKLLYLRATPRSARARTMLRAFDPIHADQVVAAYHGARRRQDFAQLVTDAVFWAPSIAIAESHARNGNQVWMYRYDFAHTWMRKIGMGATHSMELAYLFNDLEGSRISSVHRFGDDAQAAEVTALMQRHWGHFIHHGQPDSFWPAYNPDPPAQSHHATIQERIGRATMIINSPHTITGDPRAYRRIAWEGYTMTEWGRGITGFLSDDSRGDIAHEKSPRIPSATSQNDTHTPGAEEAHSLTSSQSTVPSHSATPHGVTAVSPAGMATQEHKPAVQGAQDRRSKVVPEVGEQDLCAASTGALNADVLGGVTLNAGADMQQTDGDDTSLPTDLKALVKAAHAESRADTKALRTQKKATAKAEAARAKEEKKQEKATHKATTRNRDSQRIKTRRKASTHEDISVEDSSSQAGAQAPGTATPGMSRGGVRTDASNATTNAAGANTADANAADMQDIGTLDVGAPNADASNASNASNAANPALLSEGGLSGDASTAVTPTPVEPSGMFGAGFTLHELDPQREDPHTTAVHSDGAKKPRWRETLMPPWETWRRLPRRREQTSPVARKNRLMRRKNP